MEKHIRLAKPVAISIVIYLISLFLQSSFALGAGGQQEINIITKPQGYLFKLENVSPGDLISREIEIVNDGKQDFEYTAILGETRSLKKRLEQLDLKVKQGSSVLYEGKLTEFKGLSPKPLKSGTSETLKFQVSIPNNFNNYYQHFLAEFELQFLAEGISVQGTTASNGDLRNTLTSSNEDSKSIPPVLVKTEIVDKLPNSASGLYDYLFLSILFVAVGGILAIFFVRKVIGKNTL